MKHALNQPDVREGEVWCRDGAMPWTYYRVMRVTPRMAVLAECDKRGRRKPRGKGRTVRRVTMGGWMPVLLSVKSTLREGVVKP